VNTDYQELDVFRAANSYLGRSRLIPRNDGGEAYAVPQNPVPELVAANLAVGRHWCGYFTTLVSKKRDFSRMLFERKGLAAMRQAVKDADDRAIIQAFQDAWNMMMGALGERARRDKLDFGRLVEVERERIRNAILRTKTADALASWFLRFCADATKGAALASIRDEANRIREFIFCQRNFDRFQNLCLFALVSYAGETSASLTMPSPSIVLRQRPSQALLLPSVW
jgi:CRISPR-associated protein Cas8a1/Csx13